MIHAGGLLLRDINQTLSQLFSAQKTQISRQPQNSLPSNNQEVSYLSIRCKNSGHRKRNQRRVVNFMTNVCA